MRIEIGIGIPSASGWGEVKEEYECYTDFKYVPHMYIHLLMPFCHCLHYTSTHFRHWTVAAMQSTHTHIVTHTHTHQWSHNPTQTPIAAAFFPTHSCLSRGFYWIYLPTCPQHAPTPPTLSLALGQHNWPGQLVPRSRLVALCRDIRFQIPFLRSIFFSISAALLHLLPSLIYACLLEEEEEEAQEGDQGCQVATCRATALSFDLGFAFFTRCGPLTD